jgi:hypothetical protein
MVLMRLAAYGTHALLDFRDFDEFLVIPSGQSVHQLLAPGGCLSDIRQLSQALITSRVTVSLNFTQRSPPGGAGELCAWLEYDVWVDALRALNYSSAPQAYYGWKAIVDPNFDYNFICKSRGTLFATELPNDCCSTAKCIARVVGVLGKMPRQHCLGRQRQAPILSQHRCTGALHIRPSLDTVAQPVPVLLHSQCQDESFAAPLVQAMTIRSAVHSWASLRSTW